MAAMTYEDVYDALCETELPVIYNFWDSPENIPALPYIVFTYPYHRDFYADNANFAEIVGLQVSLYTSKKSITTEKAVEAVLSAHFETWQKDSTYIPGDAVQETQYVLEVLIKNGE